jgi:hypothetical protein
VAQTAEPPIGQLVADVLFERAMTLYGQGDTANAKQLFIEALERDPAGPRAQDSTAMIKSCNERLGLSDKDGMPGHQSSTPVAPPKQPTVDSPQPEPPPEAVSPGPSGLSGTSGARIALTVWGGLYGFAGGLAIGGPLDDSGDTSATGLALGVAGAGAGAAAGHFLSKRFRPSLGTAATITALGFWGSYNAWMIGDVATGDDSDTNDLYKYLAVGGLVGTGAGTALAVLRPVNEGDVAMVNSLTTYGSALGLLLAVVIDPPRSEAFSLQASVGSVAGMATGFALTNKLDLTRKRTLWIDVGAGGGALAPWLLIYPFITDSDSNNDEQLVGALSMLTLAGGVVTSWYFTRNLDRSSADDPGTAFLMPTLLPTASGPAPGLKLFAGTF